VSTGRRWFGATLTVRAVLATCLVALVSVAITAAIALPLTVRSANDEIRLALSEKAQVAANAIEGRATAVAADRQEARAAKVAATLRGQGIETVLVINGKPDHLGLPARVINQVTAGQSVSSRVLYDGRPVAAPEAGQAIAALDALTERAVEVVRVERQPRVRLSR